MRSLTISFALCASLVAGAVFAKDGVTNPVVKARMDVMQTVRINTGTLGDMAEGKATFDAAAATAAKTALAAAAASIVKAFEAQEDDPVSEATPAIWTNFPDFSAKAEALVTAAEAMDTSSLDGVKAGMGSVGGSCKACHEGYRAKR